MNPRVLRNLTFLILFVPRSSVDFSNSFSITYFFSRRFFHLSDGTYDAFSSDFDPSFLGLVATPQSCSSFYAVAATFFLDRPFTS